jgi:hypothetical protein
MSETPDGTAWVLVLILVVQVPVVAGRLPFSLNHLRFDRCRSHERNVMSSRLHHVRPRKKQRQASRTARFLVALLFVIIFALAVALAATGRGVPAGRFIP